TVLATLLLTVAGPPCMCHLTLIEGLFIDDAMQTVPMFSPAGLEIVVTGP
ncbi:MAG: hypothetical protein GX616_16270, partial [Planctomycetes bacterium]|nr:hypothetical protein [Planctomycetota bacterium]